MLLYDEILENAPTLRKVIEEKIESEKEPLQKEINSLQETVDFLTITLFMGGEE